VAVYGITFRDWLELVVFIQLINYKQLTLIDFL
jgi:hypothetical protein